MRRRKIACEMLFYFNKSFPFMMHRASASDGTWLRYGTRRTNYWPPPIIQRARFYACLRASRNRDSTSRAKGPAITSPFARARASRVHFARLHLVVQIAIHSKNGFQRNRVINLSRSAIAAAVFARNVRCIPASKRDDRFCHFPHAALIRCRSSNEEVRSSSRFGISIRAMPRFVQL